jgi:hypothetical protein
MAIRHILFFIFRCLARWRLPGVAAWLLHVTSRRLSLGTETNTPEKRCRALLMTRAGFLEDISESFRTDDSFEVVCWPSFALKAFSAAILAPSLDHNNYLTDDPEAEKSKLAYRRFLADLWRRYRAIVPIDVALTGNFAYFTEREFATALEEAGTPFIALHKENVRPPRRVNEYWFTLYQERRGKFTGRKVLVYNDIERDLEIATGVAQREQVVVTGAPRLDRLHRWRREHGGKPDGAHKPTVLFFAFSRQDKLTAIQRKSAAGVPGNMEDMKGEWGKLSWGRFCVDTHRAVVDLARMRPDMKVVVKSKGQSRKLNDIRQMLDDIKEPLPPNLEVIHSGDPYDLIVQSDVVVGFNTTGLLEAIAAGKPVIVPFFGEAREESMRDMIIDLGEAVEYAHSPAELTQMICAHVDQRKEVPHELPEAARRTLRYWVGNEDGEAGRRVVKAGRAELVNAGP